MRGSFFGCFISPSFLVSKIRVFIDTWP
jgi:hypothetical protein